MIPNIQKYPSAVLLFFLFVGGLCFTSCGKDDDKVADLVRLEVFGPSPILRGGELRFIGSNLSKVTAIILPGGQEITDITEVSAEEIRITIPQDATSGYITLRSPEGDITTKTPLTFSEPISISKVSPAAVKAGDLLTIEGEYLNLIAEVIFEQGVVVSSADFNSTSRKKIELKVPKEAQSGKISLSNGAEIPIIIYSEAELVVALPTLTAVAPNPVKPGAELIIKGTDFHLVKSILFADDISVDDFGIGASNTEITVNVPELVKEGPVKLVAFSGVEIESAQLELIGPAIETLTPNPVKNETVLEIKGTDLDLVTAVVFEGEVEGTIAEQTATRMKVVVPATAKDGAVTLQTASGKVAIAALSLVKPTLASLSPSTLVAGEEVTISGTHLDLVQHVIFGGQQRVADVTAASATTLRVRVPMAALTGYVTLVTTNGTEIVSANQLNVSSPNVPVIVSMPSSAKPGELIQIEGSKLHLVESIYFPGNVKATQYLSRSEASIQVYVPEGSAKGSGTLRLVAFDGTEVVSPSINISGVDPVTDPSYVFFDFDSKGKWWGTYGNIENNAGLSLDGSSYYRINENLPSGWVDFFWRNGANDLRTEGVTVAGWVIKMDVNVLGGTTQEFKFRLNGTDGDYWAIIPPFQNRGGWYTVTIPLTSFKDGDGTGSNTLPNVQNINADFGLATNGAAGAVNICIDNIRFERK